MSQIQILEKPEIKQQIKASQILRTTTIEQCTGEYQMGGRYCAMGVLMKHFGYVDQSHGDVIALIRCDTILGLDRETRVNIIHMNDMENRSFGEIADFLEERGL